MLIETPTLFSDGPPRRHERQAVEGEGSAG